MATRGGAPVTNSTADVSRIAPAFRRDNSFKKIRLPTSKKTGRHGSGEDGNRGRQEVGLLSWAADLGGEGLPWPDLGRKAGAILETPAVALDHILDQI